MTKNIKQMTAGEADTETRLIVKDLTVYLYMPSEFHPQGWQEDLATKKVRLIDLAKYFVIAERSLRAVNNEYDALLGDDETDVDPADWYMRGEDVD